MPSSEANEVIGARVPLVRTTERMPRLISVNACIEQVKSTPELILLNFLTVDQQGSDFTKIPRSFVF